MVFNTLYFYYSIFVKKYLLGKCIIQSKIDKTSHINGGCSVYDSKISQYSYMGYGCEIIGTDIGSFCSIASGVHIGLAEHPLDWVSTSPVFQEQRNSSMKKRFAKIHHSPNARTIIGHDVWIGTNAIIKAGLKIGTGAAIASGAIVTKDVEPYAIVGGCPAKLIRYRFEKELRESLLESQWWDADDDILKSIGKYADNPEKFIEALMNTKNRNSNK